ncbi:hypothetical protein [Paenibacillus hexagrammi]|uniref:Uncharacterized protein n=1 Tax=Paenibacillus hexagrammi TaxID=2908839 RepID=A0ABY3SR16_9BACL|nr:hypothetical protein [Paenibacillus sp. YPD9-1]UJF35601.1 hypothetical protein L0M14_11195 [Paenibacillus sp. YPD9-1]
MPIPCVNVEWVETKEISGQDAQELHAETGARYFSLYSIPDYLEASDGTVHYGSLGAIQEEGVLIAAAMSGVLMFNGEKDTYYIAKNRTETYQGGYLDFAEGFTLSKSYALDWGTLSHSGHAYRELVGKAVELFAPEGKKPLLLEEMIRLKTYALDDRWRTGGKGCGRLCEIYRFEHVRQCVQASAALHVRLDGTMPEAGLV